MTSNPDLFNLDRVAAAKVLDNPDSSAIACYVASCAVLGKDEDGGSPLFDDEDEQPEDPVAVHEMLRSAVPDYDPDNLQKIQGLVHAVAGDEFWSDPDHFTRMSAAILHGDPYYYEDEAEEPTLIELMWAIYQVDLLMEEDADELLEEPVLKFLTRLAEEQPIDLESLALEEDFTGPIEEYYQTLLRFRRIDLGRELVELGMTEDQIAELDEEMVQSS